MVVVLWVLPELLNLQAAIYHNQMRIMTVSESLESYCLFAYLSPSTSKSIATKTIRIPK